MNTNQPTHRQSVTPTPKIVWTPDLSLNDESLDAQHQKLFALTNSLIDNSDAATNSELINETLYELLKYINVHFINEEALLEKTNYPKLEEHRIIHRTFTKKIAKFCHEVTEGKDNVTTKLTKYLSNWIVQHTRHDDLDYKNYL